MKTEHFHWLLILAFVVLVGLLFVFQRPDVKGFSFDTYRPSELKGNTYEGFDVNRQETSGPLEYSPLLPSNSNLDMNSLATSDQRIDPFFGVKSSQECQGSGYTKGNGNICLTDSLKKDLTTRGGNITGGDSQIG